MLLCGLDAVNIVLRSLNQDYLVRQELDQIADNLAVSEALLLTDGDAQETLPHPKGFYHISVLIKAAEIHAGLSALPVTPSYTSNPRAVVFLLGSRDHWQAIIKQQGKWTLRDEKTMEGINNLTGFLRTAASHGMALMLYKADGSADINNDAVTTTAEAKRTRAGDSRNAPPAITDSPFTPLPEDTTTRDPLDREAKRQKSPEWSSITIGQTTILHDPVSGRFRCPRPSCAQRFTNESSQSVIIHLTRHCVKQKPQEPPASEAAQPGTRTPEVSVPGAIPVERARETIPIDDKEDHII